MPPARWHMACCPLDYNPEALEWKLFSQLMPQIKCLFDCFSPITTDTSAATKFVI